MGTCTCTTELGLKTPNTKGQLARITGPIAEAKVNITALTAVGTGSDAWFWFVTDNNTTAKDRLTKAGFQVTERDCCCLELANKPGTCFAAATTLANGGVNIDHWYYSSAGGGTAKIYFACDDCKKAATLLA